MIVNALLFLFAASIPLTDVSRVYLGAGSLAEILLVALVGAWLWEARRGLTFRLDAGLILLYGVTVLAVWSWWIAEMREPTGALPIPDAALVREFEYLAVAVVLAQLARSSDRRLALLGGLLAGLGVALAFGAAQWGLGASFGGFNAWGPPWAGVDPHSDFRVWGSFGHPLNLVNHLAAFLGMLTVFGLRDTNRHRRVMWVVLLAITVLGLFTTGSRIALLVMLLPAWYGLRGLPRANRRWLLLLGALVSIPVMASSVASVALERLLELGTDDFSVSQRVLVFESALWMMIEHPVLGVGPGRFAEVYFPAYMEPNASLDPATFTPENMLLLAGAELGIPAMTLFALAVGVLVRQGFALGSSSLPGRDRILSEASAFAATCLVAASMVQTSSDAASRLLLYTLFGLIVALAEPLPAVLRARAPASAESRAIASRPT